MLLTRTWSVWSGLTAAVKSLNITARPLHDVVTTKISNSALLPAASVSVVPCRQLNYRKIFMPHPGKKGYNYKFKVNYPEDMKYTIDHLSITKRAGRDPDTGHVIVNTVGGGRKTKYRWVDFDRSGPTEAGVFKEERVIEIQEDPNRTAHIALVGGGGHLRYIIATHTMKAGDLIRSSSYIPPLPIRPTEGDSYPIGALPIGTIVCHLELVRGEGAKFLLAAGAKGRVMRRISDKKVVVQQPNKHEVALDQNCMVVAGQVSNLEWINVQIGSAQRLRWLGKRPSSGLWQRKDGYKGRKIRSPPPIKQITARPPKIMTLRFSCATENVPDFVPCTDRKT